MGVNWYLELVGSRRERHLQSSGVTYTGLVVTLNTRVIAYEKFLDLYYFVNVK